MSTRQLVRIAMMACIETVIFGSFSDILYLECITMTIVLFALVFDKKESFWAAVVFGIMNMLVRQGVNLWSMMYLIIYPLYSLLISALKRHLLNRFKRVAIITGILSFLTGQLLELPFLLFSTKITVFYLLMGLKTSLIQGCVSAVACGILGKSIFKVLIRIRKEMK